MDKNDGVRAGSRASHEAADASSPKASIPDAELRDMSDSELADRVRHEAYMAVGRRHCVHDENCSALYREAVRRERPWLYAQGWNRFYAASGGYLTDSDIRAAQAIEARSGETEGLDPKDESAVGNADAPETPTIQGDSNV